MQRIRAGPQRRLRKLKIAFLARSLNYGGAERQLATLTVGLHECGHEVTVVVFYGGGPIEAEIGAAGVPVHALNKRSRWHAIGFFIDLVRQLRRLRPDVVHSYLTVPNVIAAIAKPFLFNHRLVFGVRASSFDLDQYDWLTKFSATLERRLSFAADRIIANSRAGFEHYLSLGWPGNRMVVIPNGIDVDTFASDREARSRIRAEWRVGDDQPLIGLVGRLDVLKDHPTFLRAAARLAETRLDIRFVCVGDGPDPYRQSLKQMADDLGLSKRVIWANFRGDMPAVYNALDILCLSSVSEGFPNVVGEAMACGVPCVVTDVGDAANIVGDTGIVVPPGNPEAMAQGLIEMLGRNSADGRSPRERIVANFGHERMIQATTDALQDVVQ